MRAHPVVEDREPGCVLRFARASALRASRIGGSSRRSLRHRAQQSSHSHDVARCHRQLEVLVDAPDPSVDRLADAPDGLTPAEVFLDALADRLTDRIASVSRRSSIDRAAADTSVVTRHVWCDAPPATGVDGVVAAAILHSVRSSHRLRSAKA